MRCKMENLSLIYKVENYVLFLGMKNVIQLLIQLKLLETNKLTEKLAY